MSPPPLVVYDQQIEVALPSLDTGRGIDLGYERWWPAQQLSFEVRGEARETAAGDYTGFRIGGGVEMKWFWRADHEAWLSVVPARNMVGWFLGAGLYLDGDFTHDNLDRRWLGSDLTVGTVGRIGYRIAPWRALTITPSAGLEIQRDYDLSGRLESVARGGATFGLDVGWLFF